MQVKVLLALVAAALVAGRPEPEPEADPETKFQVKVDSGDSKQDSYLQVVETPGETSFKLISKISGEANGYKCCRVKKEFTYDPVVYIEYPNGATDVPCGGRLNPANGTCVDGNVVCEIDNMGIASSEVTFVVDNNKTVESITVDVVPGSSLFDVMLIANQTSTDNEFRFTYTLSQGGVMIQSIGGVGEPIPEGACEGWYWALYNCTVTPCAWALKGVSQTNPNNGDIWKFKYTYSNWCPSHSG